MSEPPKDQQIEIVQLQTNVETIKAEVKDIWDMLKELSQRKIPWLSVIGVVAPILTIVTGFSLQSIVTVNLTADRTITIQKTIDQNAIDLRRQYDAHTQELKELRGRVDAIERVKVK
jgi:hypothetical protein